MEKFFVEYEKQLRKAVLEHPEEYYWDVSLVPSVVAKMKQAVLAGTYNKDGRAFKGTCKALGIKYTYTAINEFIAQNQ